MAHDHAHGASDRSRLLVVIGIVAVVLVAEVLGGLLSGSLALLADAGHMLSDLTGLIVALVAAVVAARPATDRQTYGYRRAEVFGALINALILIGVAIGVTLEAIPRLASSGDVAVQSTTMLLVGLLGLAANIAAMLVLRGGDRTSLNLRGAALEVFGDLVGSLAVIVAALVIAVTGFLPADAIASLLIAAMIIPRAVVLLRDVVRVLSQSVPPETSVAEIRRHILGTEGVVDVHDVHVWAITSGAHVFSAHVVVESRALAGEQAGCLLDELSECLSQHFDVEHSTFQLEPAEHAAHEHPHHA
ncbi:cation diffusion facilitator family transporter [Rathayibacter sp. YIM 133350]|uniref:cation diffusion facilitator family transporter n=1 Tax=Rathayibacter sp. YIM 133350 TaxID=3131992 RepID=UPI00307D00B6